MPKGPRIVFKDDRDSSIGRGCIIYPGMLEPDIILMVQIAAEEAPPLEDQIMVVSEGWRPTNPSGRVGRDEHKNLRAWDISYNQILITEHTIPEYILSRRHEVGDFWAARVKKRLPMYYDVKSHGEGLNKHMHMEKDP